MRRRSSIYPLLIGWCCAASAVAQPAPQPAPPATPPPSAEPAPSEPAPAEPAPAPEGEPAPAPEEPTAEPPPAEQPAPPALPPPELEVPTPAEMEQKLTEGLPPAPAASGEWTAPSPVFTLHGYFRMRGELMDTFWLGREQTNVVAASMNFDAEDNPLGPDPFTRFRPLERRYIVSPTTGDVVSQSPCVDEDTISTTDLRCDVSTLQFANLRLRLSPQLNLGEDVRVKATFDILDNVVAGEVPQSFYGTGPIARSSFAGTDLPPNDNNIGDSIKARRAWAEIRNRDLGELRFGRMAQQWGLGMYYNAGDGIDDDVSTDLDRALLITRLAGIYLSASYDFIAEGVLEPDDYDRPLDASQLDDVDQFTFSAALRDSPEELAASIERGEWVFNAGVQFTLRNQDAYDVPALERGDTDAPLRELEATTYTPDLWLMLRYRGFRLEAEVAWVLGGMDNVVANRGSYDISQIGYALEAEFRFLDDRLGLYVDHGLATGDPDVEGLSSDANYINQLGETQNDSTISTFRFHPNYRVDLILWRNIMQQVTGAYYFRPGISYDFIRSDFGQLLGARLDFIYSRASVPLQTWGNDANLGIEIDVSVYFRTEDGPELDDGYHALLQYGVLFPMRGLGYYFEDTDLDTAQTLRLLLGVAF